MKRFLIVFFVLCGGAFSVAAQGDVINIIDLDETVAGYDTRAASLSPDGSMVAFIHDDDETLCIYQTTDGSLSCTALPDETPLVDTEQLVWSLDSTKIALTESHFSRNDEPDIWLFDVKTLTISNRTADGLPENAYSGLIDLHPTWSSDGSLYFLRSIQEGERFVTSLQRISPDNNNNTEEEVMMLDDFFYDGLWQPAPMISPDGSQIAIAINNREDDISFEGIYLVDLTTGTYERVFALNETFITGTSLDNTEDLRAGLSQVFLTSIRWVNNDVLLIMLEMTRTSPTPIVYVQVDLITGHTRPLIDLSDRDETQLMMLDEALQIPYRSYYPVAGLLAIDTQRFYYGATDREMRHYVLSLPLLTDNQLPIVEFQIDYQLRTGIFPEGILSLISDDGRYGLYAGKYLIEFAIEGTN